QLADETACRPIETGCVSLDDCGCARSRTHTSGLDACGTSALNDLLVSARCGCASGLCLRNELPRFTRDWRHLQKLECLIHVLFNVNDTALTPTDILCECVQPPLADCCRLQTVVQQVECKVCNALLNDLFRTD